MKDYLIRTLYSVLSSSTKGVIPAILNRGNKKLFQMFEKSAANVKKGLTKPPQRRYNSIRSRLE